MIKMVPLQQKRCLVHHSFINFCDDITSGDAQGINIYAMTLPNQTIVDGELCSKQQQRNERHKKWRDANRHKIKQQNQSFYAKTKQQRKSRDAEYYELNKAAANERSKQYYKENADKCKQLSKKWIQENRELINERNRIPERRAKRKERHEQRCLQEEMYLIKHKLRICVYSAFVRIKMNKPTNTLELLGCTWQQAKEHIEERFQPGMSWANHGEWHIDHIRPVASFGPEDVHLMNHFTNLQPLWAPENLSKSCKYDGSSNN